MIFPDQSTIKRFCRKRRIALLTLFGSHAGGTARTGSDLDIAVQFANPAHRPNVLTLIAALETLFAGQVRVDVTVLFPETSYVLRNEIFTGGRPLFEDTAGLFARKKYRAWLLFQDAKPLLDRYHRQHMRAFAEKMRRVA